MKSHKFKLHLQVHKINLNLSFPCNLGANLCIDGVEHDVFDKIDKQQAKQQIHQEFSTQISMLYNPRTSQYSIKQCIITFSAYTKSNKITLGSTTLFLNKHIQTTNHSTLQINKCSDKSASFQYSLSLSFLQQSQPFHIRHSLIQQSPKKLSMLQGRRHNLSKILSSSSILSPGKLLLLEKGKLCKSIVQEEDREIESDQQMRKERKGEDDEHQNNQLMYERLMISYSEINSPRLTDRSRISDTSRITQKHKQSSFYENINNNDSNNESILNNSRISLTRTPHRRTMSNHLQTPTSPKNRSRTNSYFNNQQPTNAFNIISIQQKKLQNFQAQTQTLQKQNNELKQQIKKLKQIHDDELFKQNKYIEKLQIQQNNMRNQLIKIKEKYAKIEKQLKETLYQRNQLLNNLSNTNKEHQIIGQLKNKQVLYEKQQIKLLEKIQSLNNVIQQKQIKITNLQSKNKQQQIHIHTQVKKSQYYRTQLVSLDEKLQQAKAIQEKLRLQLQQAQDLLFRQRQMTTKYKEQLHQAKCLINSTQTIKNSQIQSLQQQLESKDTQIHILHTQLTQKISLLTSQLQQCQLHNCNLNQQIKQINSTRLQDLQTLRQLQQINEILQHKLFELEQSSSSQLQEKSQQICHLVNKIEQYKNQLYIQQQINFDLEERIGEFEQKIISKNQQIQILSHSLLKLGNQLELMRYQQQLLKQNQNQLQNDIQEMLKQFDNKNKELLKCDHIIQQLQRKNQQFKNFIKENLEKFQKSNQDNIDKNKQIIDQQNLLNQKGNEMYTLKIKANDLQIQNSRLKRQNEQNTKRIKTQQEQLTKINTTLNIQHQKMAKKQQQLKNIQRQLKILQGKVFTFQKKKQNILIIEDSQYQLKPPSMKSTRSHSSMDKQNHYHSNSLLKQHTNSINSINHNNNDKLKLENQNNIIIIKSNKQNII